MSYKTGWAVKQPEGNLNGFYRSQRLAEKSTGKNWPKLFALGWRTIPVVMVEIPEPDADGKCGDCPIRNVDYEKGSWCNLDLGIGFDGDVPGPNCPAGKGREVKP
jgi:hypothetical protein